MTRVKVASRRVCWSDRVNPQVIFPQVAASTVATFTRLGPWVYREFLHPIVQQCSRGTAILGQMVSLAVVLPDVHMDVM